MRFERDTKVYVAGCGGMLGAAVYAHFARRCTVCASDIAPESGWLSQMDVRDYRAVRQSISAFRPDLVINLAALTDLEQCEREPDNAWLTNALGAENVGLVARELNVPYVYISTAGVFDGKQEHYSEFDVPNPLGNYGKSKFYGERWTRQSVQKHFVFRAGWMMGGGPAKDKKFINKIFKQIRAGKRELRVVSDKAGTPTYTHDFARGLQRVVESDRYGLYHQVCQGDATRLDVARAFVDELGFGESVRILEVPSSALQNEYFAPRPASERLRTTTLDATGLNMMRNWRTCLHEYAQVFRRVVRDGAGSTIPLSSDEPESDVA